MAALVFLAACELERSPPPPAGAVTVAASVETPPVASSGDAADDPAIWVNPADPAASLVLGTDKQASVEVYTLRGDRLQSIRVGRPNNIDLRMLDDDEDWSALAAASNRTAQTISLFLVDQQGTLHWLQDSEISTGLTEVYGLCMFRNEVGLQVFVNDTDGRYQQWLLRREASTAGNPRFSGQLLREFQVPDQPEGCVADDEQQRLFLGIEAQGVRTVAASHENPARLTSLADIDGSILAADVEGMSLYKSGAGGSLVVSSQGNHSFALYDRLPPHSYRGSFVVADNADGTIDGVSDTDGIDVSSVVRTADFPEGLIVVQDGANRLPRAAQNFKLVSWQLVAEALGLQ